MLVFANWGKPEESQGVWHFVFAWKWTLTALAGAGLGVLLVAWFNMCWWKVLGTAIAVSVAALVVPHEPLVPFTVAVLGLTVITTTGNEEA